MSSNDTTVYCIGTICWLHVLQSIAIQLVSEGLCQVCVAVIHPLNTTV